MHVQYEAVYYLCLLNEYTASEEDVDKKDRLEKEVRRRFRRDRIMTLAMLMESLQCSRSTAQRRLKTWRCYTSYNHNGSYYALPETVKFDQYGVWNCESVCFSQHGNLTETVAALVDRAPAGMTAAELSDVLAVNANTFISTFARCGKVGRKRVGTRFVYTSCDSHTGSQQIRQRIKNEHQHAQLSASDAVTVLVELVKCPDLGTDELSQAVRLRVPAASPDAIEQLLNSHGITAAKKRASRPLL